jgi:phospholipid transport system substrate-binding protein
VIRITTAIVFGAFAFATVANSAPAPNTIVEEAVALLAERLDGRKDELTTDKQALYALIDDILLPRFDREYAAALVLGQHWRTASDEQRQRFIEAFYQAILHRYAEGILEFEQDRVQVLPFRGDATKKRTMVKTIVQLEDGTKVPVNYALVNRQNRWLFFDVTIEGVSYVRNFRAELDAEIRTTSLAKVIERLEGEAGIATNG